VFVAVELICRFGMNRDYTMTDAYMEYLTINENMTVLRTVDTDTDCIFAIDRWGFVRKFNILPRVSDLSDDSAWDADNMEIYQCRKWRLTPIEYVVMKYQLSRIAQISNKDESVMEYYYGGATCGAGGSYYRNFIPIVYCFHNTQICFANQYKHLTA
jgi:hypothetical protein